MSDTGSVLKARVVPQHVPGGGEKDIKFSSELQLSVLVSSIRVASIRTVGRDGVIFFSVIFVSLGLGSPKNKMATKFQSESPYRTSAVRNLATRVGREDSVLLP